MTARSRAPMPGTRPTEAGRRVPCIQSPWIPRPPGWAGTMLQHIGRDLQYAGDEVADEAAVCPPTSGAADALDRWNSRAAAGGRARSRSRTCEASDAPDERRARRPAGSWQLLCVWPRSRCPCPFPPQWRMLDVPVPRAVSEVPPAWCGSLTPPFGSRHADELLGAGLLVPPEAPSR